MLYIMAKGTKAIIFFIFLLVGLYTINSSFNFINLPKFITDLDNWISLVGGILIIIGGFVYLKISKGY